MSLSVKTGALWEKKEVEEEEDLDVGPSKVFLNRHVQKDFRVNEVIRKRTLKDKEGFFTTAELEEQRQAAESSAADTGPVEIEATKKPDKVDESDDEEDEKKALRKRKEEQTCTKEEYAVAKHLRFNTLAHTGRMAGMTVKCFVASDAVNCLLDSKWAKGKANPDSEIIFTDRRSVISFLNRFIDKGLFHRADKVEKKKDKDKKKKKKEQEEKEKEKEKEKESASEGKKTTTKEKRLKKNAEKELEEAKKEEKEKEKKGEVKARKFKLNMSDDQRFVDGNSIYVWIYDPIHPKTFLIGFLMLLGAAALCLFPLWPDWMRIGVYWVSLLGASFVGFMLFLIVFRVIIFAIVWVLTLGKHHLWIFPNLTEDVGVIESFQPLYKHERYPPPEVEEEMKKQKEKEEKEEEEEEEDEVEGDSENDDKNDNENGFEIVKDEESIGEEES